MDERKMHDGQPDRGEHGREGGSRARELARTAKKSLEAGASGVVDGARKAADVAHDLREAEPDAQLRDRAENATERVIHATADAVRGAAPTVGRGVEGTLKATGKALHTLAGPIGTAVGVIAGKAGGWWHSASDSLAELPEEQEQACRVYFESYTARPAELTWDDARTAYTIGWIAAANPDYGDREFDTVEPDIRPGIDREREEAYTSLRDFARQGYHRGRGVRR